MQCGCALNQRCIGCETSVRWHARFCPKCGVHIEKKKAELAAAAEKKKQEEARLREEARIDEERQKAEEKKRSEQTIIESFFEGDLLRDYSSGVIFDSKANLEWLIGPNSDTTHMEAEEWASSLGSRWRLPKRAELKGLYERGVRCSFKEAEWTPPFESANGGCFVWTEELKEGDTSLAWDFLFCSCAEGLRLRTIRSKLRAFAVRSR